MNYIDFHVHIDFYKNPIKIINSYEENKIYALFVTNLPEIYKQHLKTYGNSKYIKLALGYQPEMVDFYEFNKDMFDSLISTTNYIGEVGIDASKKNIATLQKQTQIFDYICSKIKDSSKVVSIHSKKADSTVLDILKQHHIQFAVFHWYSGNCKLIDDILQCGYYFSVNPNMLQSIKGREILHKIPLNRILFETDGPFTKFEKTIMSPLYIEKIYSELNDFYGVENIKSIIFNNFKTLLLERQLSEEKNTLFSSEHCLSI